MQSPNLGPFHSRLFRILVITTFLLVMGMVLLALPTARPVYAGSLYLDQCANTNITANPMQCDWTPGLVGNSNSHYIEGMGVPQRVLLQNLYSGSAGSQCNNTTRQCGLNFSSSWSSSSVHGYDFLISWETAAALNVVKTGVSAFLLNPCQGYNSGDTASCTDVYTTNRNVYAVTVPDDPFISGGYQVSGSTQQRIDAFEGVWGNRTIVIYANAPITSATLLLSHWTNNLSGQIANGADTSGQTVISYTLLFTTNATSALVAMAGHLAEGGNPYLDPLAWGYTNGAGAIPSGSSWHFKDPKFNGVGGSQDNQLNLAEASAWPIDSSVSDGAPSTIKGITDTVVMTNTASGASDIAGYMHFYVCADTTVPYSPGSSSSIPNGCLTRTSGSGYTVSDVGTKTLTIVNAGSNKNSTAVSPSFTATVPGRYCFLTVFTPTDAIPYNYSVMSDTNGTGECFLYQSPTPVRLSSFGAGDGMDWTMIVGAFGLLGVMASIGVVKFGSRRD